MLFSVYNAGNVEVSDAMYLPFIIKLFILFLISCDLVSAQVEYCQLLWGNATGRNVHCTSCTDAIFKNE